MPEQKRKDFNILGLFFQKLRREISIFCCRSRKRLKISISKCKGFPKTPYFYYVLAFIVLLGLVHFEIPQFFIPSANSLKAEVAFLKPVFEGPDSSEGTLSSRQNQSFLLEPPGLKIIQGDSLAAFASPRALSPKVLGAVFGQGPQIRKEIIEYTAQPGDTLSSIAGNFDISLSSLLSANNLTSRSTIKVGQKLVILPVSGVVHFVKTGDTLNEIAKTYKAEINEIIEWNEIIDGSEIYVGDILVIPNGVMPSKPSQPAQTRLADSFFIFPVEGRITQTLHWYNAVDIANKCGTPVFAAAPGEILRANYGWNSGGGNLVTIRHQGGVVTYYGHLMTISVRPGQRVDVGERIGLVGGQRGMPGAGISTGCHLHFSVIGATNPLAKYPLWYEIKYGR